MGFASLTAAILAPLIPGVAIWLFYWLRKKAALAVVAFLLGAVLVIAPVMLRNYTIGGDIVPISYNGGVEFLPREQRKRRADARVASGMGVGGTGCAAAAGRDYSPFGQVPVLL